MKIDLLSKHCRAYVLFCLNIMNYNVFDKEVCLINCFNCYFAGKERTTQARMIINVPFSYSRYRTGTRVQLRLKRAFFLNAKDIKLF